MDTTGNRLTEPNGVTPEAPAEPLNYAEPQARTGADALAVVAMTCAVLFLPALIVIAAVDDSSPLLLVAVSLPFIALPLGLIARRSEKKRGVTNSSTARASLVVAWIEVGLILIVAMILPQMGRPREPANRVKCGSNLREIDQAVRLYANQHAGHFPPDLETLLLTEEITASVFVCPSSNDERADGPTTQAVIQVLRSKPHYCSYIYVGANLMSGSVTDAHVVAYEPLSNHSDAGMNVLFGDGRVEFLGHDQALRVLDELQYGHNPPRVGPTSGR